MKEDELNQLKSLCDQLQLLVEDSNWYEIPFSITLAMPES
jgi:hypothetical protein